jgi:hypothetical protein
MPPRRAAPIVVALLASLVAVACTPTAPTPSPGSTDSATGAPSTVGPSASEDPGLARLMPYNAVAVVVDRLPVRFEPSPAGESQGDLVRGDVAVLQAFEPVELEGVVWYYATQVGTDGPGKLPELPFVNPVEETLAGWIAASDATGETIAKLAPRCPETWDFTNLSAMLDGERLACFGAEAITLDGRFGCVGCGAEPGTFEPAWLAGAGAGSLSAVGASGPPWIPLHFPVAVEAPANEAYVRVTGHFDDPAAITCQMAVDPKPRSFAIAVELCRQRFVVDSWEPLSSEFIPPPD